MERQRIDSASLPRAIEVLSRGGVVAHPTETCYGLACDLRNSAALERLFAIKRRPRAQPVSALFASLEEAKRYIEWNAAAEAFRGEFPGPITLVLPLHPDAPAPLLPCPAGGTTIGVRVSSHPFAAALAAAFGAPISTTSANIHGQPNSYDADVLASALAGGPEPDLLIDAGRLPEVRPSRVVDCTKQNPEILRS